MICQWVLHPLVSPLRQEAKLNGGEICLKKCYNCNLGKLTIVAMTTPLSLEMYRQTTHVFQV